MVHERGRSGLTYVDSRRAHVHISCVWPLGRAGASGGAAVLRPYPQLFPELAHASCHCAEVRLLFGVFVALRLYIKRLTLIIEV